jgi:uncharacterized protein Smg (DUF494 family)
MPDYPRMIQLLSQLSEEQQKQIEALHGLVTAQAAALSRYSAEIETLTVALAGLGKFLISAKVIPPEAANFIVSTLLDVTDWDTQGKARRVVEMLKAWSSSA